MLVVADLYTRSPRVNGRLLMLLFNRTGALRSFIGTVEKMADVDTSINDNYEVPRDSSTFLFFNVRFLFLFFLFFFFRFVAVSFRRFVDYWVGIYFMFRMLVKIF